MSSIIRSAITGVGAYLPERKVSNADLAKIVDTSDDWIVERTGIQSRRYAAEGQGTSDLAVEAARGRFAVRIVSDGKEIPYRVKLRSPSLSNLSLFEEASRGMLLPDALALMGSLDLVIPDIDR